MGNPLRSSAPGRGRSLAIWGTAALLCLALAPSSPAEEQATDKFQIFGFLTQAYGRSSRGSIFGTEHDGSTDLGNVAIQFRWNRSVHDAVVIQIAHERRGDDLFLPSSEGVDIDWAFYERRLHDNTSIKVGRLNIPQGIYNEVRDVGTLLPFFSLPISFYPGVLSSAETVDGVSVSHTFLPRSDWELDAELYFGGWDTFQQQVDLDSRFGIVNLEARAEEGLGLQLWLDTSVQGLRFGAGMSTWRLDGPLSVHGSRDSWESYHASVDLSREKWVLRAEARHWAFDLDFGAFLGMPDPLPGEADRDGFYVQAGVWVTPKIGLFAQFDSASLQDDLDLLPGLDDFHEAAAASFNYRFSPDFLVRVEFHTAETRFPLGTDDQGGVGADPVDVDWTIVALSVSF
ncbi:MAG: hypothetical protein GY716_08705 [bacterium]|nr:hypothetical protein [bacterium]